jgi:hypothetical protein
MTTYITSIASDPKILTNTNPKEIYNSQSMGIWRERILRVALFLSCQYVFMMIPKVAAM